MYVLPLLCDGAPLARASCQNMSLDDSAVSAPDSASFGAVTSDNRSVRWVTDFLTFLGATNGSGRWYLWWSGIVGDIGLFGAGWLLYRKYNCHVQHCWRISRHTTPEGHAVCHTHNPAHVPKLTFEHLVHLHETRTSPAVTPPSDAA
jgi:hypothetical protein